MRFKPPPANSDIGWRVEFRPIEVQLTDYENAAFAVFVILLSRVIKSDNLNFLIPISKVDENMKTATKRDSVRKERFWFRKNMTAQEDSASEDSYCLMSIDQIVNGNDAGFRGLVPLVHDFVAQSKSDESEKLRIYQYLDLIAGRASGKYKTMATWIREFVRSHPEYRFDSLVNERINYDLTLQFAKITQGEIWPKELLGDKSRTTERIKG